MRMIRKPMQVPGLNLKPPIESGLQLSEDVQQTMATLVGYAVNQRVLLKATPQGVLRTTGPRLIDVKHYTGVGANDHPAMDDMACCEVLVLGHPDNAGTIWVRNSETATVDNAWPIAAGDAAGFSVNNLTQLSILCVADGDKAVVGVAL